MFKIRILIIDNDYESIKNIKNHVMKNRNSKVFHVNSIGTDIFEEISKNSIELIFLDIRFFGAYSMKTVKSIFDKVPNMLIVYYGMISESPYMDKCMEIGGVISLFRPLKPIDVDNALERCYEVKNTSIQKQTKELELKEMCKADNAMFKNKFLTTLIMGHINNENEINRSLAYYGVELGSNYRVLSIRIDKFRKVILTLEEFEKNMLLYTMIDIVEENLPDMKKCVFSHEFNSIVIILSSDESLSELIVKFNKVKDKIYDKLKIQTTVGVGRKYKSIKDLSISYLEAESGLKYRYHLGYHSVIPIEHVEPNNVITYRFPKEDEQKLVYAAVIGEYTYCHKLLENIVESINDLEIPHSLFSKIIMNIIISIARYCEEQFHDYDYEINSFFNFSEIIKITDINETFAYLDGFLDKFCKHVNRLRANEDLKILEEAQGYILKEYMRPLSLAEIAKNTSSSPEYLNKIFAENTGIYALDFLLKVRLDNAKRLMRESRKTDEVIAISIGFSSAKYFRSIFEINEKISTIDYRKKYGVFYVDKNIARQ